ncbi:TetR/AcrR family transcriptional regulator [Novosphingobium sp. 9U]|uniref:TetR/AcrR family transcriptional regulator n=1 Tax=Novosphingobium sp. 9U TaxID=2653158 RepID=UPI001359C16C|nr:TetR/AcrR family transcriptional regulator [Novosphingobium sp. 9U]
MPPQVASLAETTARSGRPTREQAQARQAELLDRALDHFLDRGFEQATIEAIAADVSMTKRTVYARYPDKAALFLAAVRRGIDRLALAPESIAATRADDLERTLIAIARLRIDLVSTPQGLKLQRIINTESYRFPEIFTTYYDVAARPTVRFLADVLQAEAKAGRLVIDQPMLAANTFMSMVVGGPVRFITSGHPLEPDEIEARVAFAVRLFLQGARPR